MQVCIILIKITSPICYTTLELSRNCSAVRSNRQAYTVYQVKSFPVIRCKSLPDGGLERTLGSYYKQNKWQKIAAVAQTMLYRSFIVFRKWDDALSVRILLQSFILDFVSAWYMQIYCKLLSRDFSKGFSLFVLFPKLQQEQNFLCSKELLKSPCKGYFQRRNLSF